RYADLSDSLADLGVFGIRARAIVAAVAGVSADALATLAPYSHVSGALDGSGVLVARVPDIGVEGYEVIVPVESRPRFWRRALELGAVPAGLDTWEIARVEAGRPEWGIDIDETTIPQEANLDSLHAISYTKGCYTGQETVARVHFRGHVNRTLRGLRFAGALAPVKASLFDSAGKSVGEISSAVASPKFGAIGLATVRR